MTLPVATTNDEARIASAIIFKASRFKGFPDAPFGFAGEVGEFGVATVQTDRATVEMLYGLLAGVDLAEVDLDALVTTDDVIVAMGHDPATYPTDLVPVIQRALDSAVSWITAYLTRWAGIA